MIDKNLPIGTKVNCKSYIKKSGCHFVLYHKNVTESGEEEIEAVKGNEPLDNITKALETDYIASLPLFDTIEKEFTGVYVGTTFRGTEQVAEYMDDTYHQWWQFRKEKGKYFAVVYYGNNKKRLVPLEDCEVVTNE